MFSFFSPRRIHEKIFFRTFCRFVIIIVFISPPDINCQTKSQRFYLYSMDRRRLIDVDCALGRKEVYENCVIRTRDECWAFGPPNLNTEYPHEYVHLMKLEYYSSHNKRRPERESRDARHWNLFPHHFLVSISLSLFIRRERITYYINWVNCLRLDEFSSTRPRSSPEGSNWIILSSNILSTFRN